MYSGHSWSNKIVSNSFAALLDVEGDCSDTVALKWDYKPYVI